MKQNVLKERLMNKDDKNPIILTLLSMCDTKNMITKGLFLVPHIDSRVKIIDNERPGASTGARSYIFTSPGIC
jgi:hypothetical protein